MMKKSIQFIQQLFIFNLISFVNNLKLLHRSTFILEKKFQIEIHLITIYPATDLLIHLVVNIAENG